MTARRGKLDRQREPVQRPADRRHGPPAIGIETKVRVGGERSVHEQLNRRAFAISSSVAPVGSSQRLDREQALASDPQRRPARDEHLNPRRQLDQLGHQHRGWEQVLEVVDDQQQLPVSQIAPQTVGSRPVGPVTMPQRAGDLGGDEGRIGQPLEPYQHGAVPVLGLETARRARQQSRVFPTPPVPISVTTRTSGSASNPCSTASSGSRPISFVTAPGRLEPAAPAQAPAVAGGRRSGTAPAGDDEQRAVLLEHPRVQSNELLTGLHSELGWRTHAARGQTRRAPPPGARTGTAPASVGPRALLERMLGRQRLELGHELTGGTGRQVGFDRRISA